MHPIDQAQRFAPETFTVAQPEPPRARGSRPKPPASARDLRDIVESVNTAMQGRVVRVGAQTAARMPAVSSGFPALDAATGLGGLPRGRITELVGRPTSGRGTIATRSVAAAAGYSAWVDVSGALDVGYLADNGVDLDRLFVLRPGRPEDALGITAHLMASGHFTIVVLDALADLAAGRPGAALATELGRFTRLVVPALARGGTAALVLSGPEHHYRALAHAAALRIALAQVGTIRRGGVLRGWRTRASILKSPGLQGGESGIEVWL
ncbi:MAG: hypothetical protein KDH92_06405 [Chloroflexi bacterium]|nr:hypothetical protein [Chloroflexota bacterium]